MPSDQPPKAGTIPRATCQYTNRVRGRHISGGMRWVETGVEREILLCAAPTTDSIIVTSSNSRSSSYNNSSNRRHQQPPISTLSCSSTHPHVSPSHT